MFQSASFSVCHVARIERLFEMIQQLHLRGFRDTDESCEIAMRVPAETLRDVSRRRSCGFSDLPMQLEILGTEKSAA